METEDGEKCSMVVFGGNCWSSIMVKIVLCCDSENFFL